MRWRASAADGSCRPEGPLNFPSRRRSRGPHRRRQRQVVEERSTPAPGYSLTSWSTPGACRARSSLPPVPRIGSVPCAVAADDGTGAGQDTPDIGVLRHAHAVIHAAGGEPVVEGEQQREPAADAKANDPGLARAALWPASQARTASRPRRPAPAGRASRGRWTTGTSPASPRRTSRAPRPGNPRSPASRPGCAGPGSCPGVVDDHNPRPRPRTRGRRQIGGHPSAGTRDRHLGHHLSPKPGTRQERAYAEGRPDRRSRDAQDDS